MPIKELFDQLMDQLRGAWRFRWLSLVVAWAICVVGWIAVMLMPRTYEASAKVYVDTRSILRPLLAGLAIDPDVTSGLDLVRQVLLSTGQIEQVAHKADLDIDTKSPEQKTALISELQSQISISMADPAARQAKGEGMYRIAFRYSNREKSIEVVQTMLDAFVENALGDQRTDQVSTDEFFNANIADIEKRLRDMELRKAEFLKLNMSALPESKLDYVGQLQLATEAANTTRDTLRIAETRGAEIQRQLDGEEPYLFGIDTGAAAAAGSAAGNDITYRIQALDKQLDELLLNYTEKHPAVISTRQQIVELKARQQEELKRVKGGAQATGSMASSLKSNPIYQNLEVAQRQTQVQIAELRQELAQKNAKISDIRTNAATVPRVAADLVALDRDYAQLTQTYNEMVRRRETASLTKAADRSGTAKFKIIEPPAAEFKPVSPNRLLLFSVVLLAALGAGAALAWLLNQLRPVFYTEKALGVATGKPVIASIGRSWIGDHQRLRISELWQFAAGMCGLVIAYGVLQLLLTKG